LIIYLQLYNDYLSNPTAERFADIPSHLKDLPRSETLLNKEVEKAFVTASKDLFKAKTQPSTLTSKKLGNMYAASVYGSLASLLDTVPSAELQGKRVALYSYGSGLAASFFTMKVKGSTEEMQKALNLAERLSKTEVRPCTEYVAALQVSSYSFFSGSAASADS
jgi:hydroxymethylglutaryl-CoA synthase